MEQFLYGNLMKNKGEYFMSVSVGIKLQMTTSSWQASISLDTHLADSRCVS